MQKISNQLLIGTVTLSVLAGGVAGAFFGGGGARILYGENGSPGISFQEVVQEESATISVVEDVAPAVVSIVVLKDVNNMYNRTGPLFFDFFGQRGSNQNGEDVRQIGGGSGFIISGDGLIATNRHVVDENDAEYQVMLADGRIFDAEVLARDHILDFALLRVDADNLPTVLLGDSDSAKTGQTVIAIGNALTEFSNTVTRGIISGKNRSVVASSGGSSELIEEAIQTDAAINPGNSGGPLVNLRGEVLGINTAVSQKGNAIGFATPINPVKRLIESFQEHGKIVRPFLGVRYTMITPQIKEVEELSEDQGAFILPSNGSNPGIVSGSPAEKAGLQEKDIIVKVGEHSVTTGRSLGHVISEFKPEESVDVVVIREGEQKTFHITLSILE